MLRIALSSRLRGLAGWALHSQMGSRCSWFTNSSNFASNWMKFGMVKSPYAMVSFTQRVVIGNFPMCVNVDLAKARDRGRGGALWELVAIVEADYLGTVFHSLGPEPETGRPRLADREVKRLRPCLVAGINQLGRMAKAPFGVIGLAYTLASALGKSENQHYSDGTFSFSAPFLATAAVSLWRGLWFWGTVALGVVRFSARSKLLMAIRPLRWMVVSLLPYSFLTYMPRIPSRHQYLAPAGFALIVDLSGGLSLGFRAEPAHGGGPTRSICAPKYGLSLACEGAAVQRSRSSDRECVDVYAERTTSTSRSAMFPDKIEEAQRAVLIRLSGVAADITAADGAPRDSIPYCYK